MAMSVSSVAFPGGGEIPRRHTCDGEDVSPPLTISDIPSDARELAILMEDPDAPSGTFAHWVAWGVGPAQGGLAEGERAPGEGANSFRGQGYRGPCPPAGQTHRYVFTVLALAEPLDLPASTTAAELRAAAAPLVLAEASLTGRYGRP
jgi:Raf kinase inhibitor-like YbhB/YbcL family protein